MAKAPKAEMPQTMGVAAKPSQKPEAKKIMRGAGAATKGKSFSKAG